jgi:heat shock protein HtpX
MAAPGPIADGRAGKTGDQMLPAYGLYGHIRNNNIKSTVLLASFALYVALLWFVCCLLWMGLTTKFDPIIMRLANQHPPTFVESLPLLLARTVDLTLAYAFIPTSVVLIWFVVAFVSHKAMIRARTGAQPVIRSLEWDLYNSVENLSITAGLPMPRVEIIETEALNAYASGLGPEDATIAVTRGLLETLTKDELETVLAHELTHIRNRDTRLMVVAIIFVGILAYGAQTLGRTVWERKHGQPLAGADIPLFAVAALVAGLAYLFGVLARFALSRTREYLADAGAVELTKRPECLVSALRKISSREDIPGMPASFHAMMISSRIDSLFSTHPPLAARIAALETYAGAVEVGVAAQPDRDRAPLIGATAADAKPFERGRAINAHSPLLPQVPFGRRKSSALAKLTEAR